MDLTGLITLNGLCPSMQFEHEFKTHEEDPVAGNDFRGRIFGENAERRWKDFKLCFYVAFLELLLYLRKKFLITKSKVC